MKLQRTSSHRASFARHAAEQYSAALHEFLVRRLRGSEDLDDMIQEVYLRLLKIEDASFIRNPRAYIFRTAAHVVYDFASQKKRANKYVVTDSEIVEQVAEFPSDVRAEDSLAKRLSTQRQLNAALAKLPELHQLVLLLYARDGHSYKEIARKLGVSVDQVERYLAAAKAALMALDWEWDK